MGKSCYLTVNFIMAASYTADNLLIAKLMYDRGFPLPPDSVFYEEAGYNDSSLFWKALKQLYSYEEINVSEDQMNDSYALQSDELKEWYLFKSVLKDTPHFEEFCEAEELLESILNYSELEGFEITVKGEFTNNGLTLTLDGDFGYAFYHGIVESILDFKVALNNKLHEWRNIVNQHYTIGGNEDGRDKCLANSA